MKITAEFIALEITTVCTLKCELCSFGIPHFRNYKHDNLDVIRKEIKNLFRIYDYVERVDIGGGEPICHPALDLILGELLKYKNKFGTIRIVTNCTLMPSDKVWNAVNKNKNVVGFLLDDYGIYSPKFKEIKERCETDNIAYRANLYHGDNQHCGGWIDYGSYDNRNYSDDELNSVIKNCRIYDDPCVAVYNGSAYLCVRNMIGSLLGYYDVSDFEKIDLLDDNSDFQQLKNVVQNFGKFPLTGCRYCNGFNVNGKRYPAAQQL